MGFRPGTAILAAVVVLSACTLMNVSNVPFSPAARPAGDKALVYVFRPDPYGGSMVVHDVTIDGKHVLSLQLAEYTVLYLPAGTHTVRVGKEALAFKPSANDLAFEVKAGQVGALSLAFQRKQMQGGFGIPTKGGLIYVPSTPAPGQSEESWIWGYWENIEGLPLLYGELKKRWYRPATAPEFAKPD